MKTGPRATQGVDVVLRILDHQLVGPGGALLGNVDNVVLREHSEGLLIIGFLSGPGGFGPRQPGLLGKWIVAVARRLHPREHPRPVMVPMSHVRTIGSAITLSPHAEQVLQGTNGLEQWLRRHVISAIPGAKAGDDRLAGTGISPPSRHDELDLPSDTHLLSDLLGASVTDDAGRTLGTVMELRADRFEETGLEVGRLRVTSVVFGRHRLGGELGYTTSVDQGPWLLARAFGWWHRQDREASWQDVADVDWERGGVILAAHARRRHPHARNASE